MPGFVRIRQAVLTAMRIDAQREPHQECCGLVAGREGMITHIYRAANVASEPAAAYEVAPEELFRIMREIRGASLEHLGIYHSHPAGENRPSTRDIERAYYPDAVYFIISPRTDATRRVRAFSIREGSIRELEIQVLE